MLLSKSGGKGIFKGTLMILLGRAQVWELLDYRKIPGDWINLAQFTKPFCVWEEKYLKVRRRGFYFRFHCRLLGFRSPSCLYIQSFRSWKRTCSRPPSCYTLADFSFLYSAFVLFLRQGFELQKAKTAGPFTLDYTLTGSAGKFCEMVIRMWG